MQKQTKMLEVKGLTKKYGQLAAVDNLSISLDQGEIFGLLGPNGAGKSTTIECILGTRSFDAGHVSLLGRNPVSDRKRLFKQVGVQFQSSHYPDRIKVKEMCELTASLYKETFNWKALLAQFSLQDKMEQMVSSLSGGECQKLSVVLALIHKPSIVFLDELTTGLDPKARRDVWKHMKSLRDQGLTIFLTSHYMDEVTHLCDRISIINHGKEIITGTPEFVVNASGKSNLEEAYLYFIGEEEDEDEYAVRIV